MTPDVYQRAASRTICDQQAALSRIVQGGPELTQLLHGVIGLIGELGEIASLIQKKIWYNKQFDPDEFKKQINLEGGDLLWYVTELCSALDLDLGEVMEANITKLRKRFPEKYTDHHAAEENRDRAKEEAHVAARVKLLREMAPSLTQEEEKAQRQSWVRGQVAEEERKTTMVQDAADRASELMTTKIKDLPPGALAVRNRFCRELGGCGEVMMTAFAAYAQVIEGLPCEDELYKCPTLQAEWVREEVGPISSPGTTPAPDYRQVRNEVFARQYGGTTGVEVGPSVAAVMKDRQNAVGGGCCDQFANQQGCDCLARAVERDRRMARGDEFCRRVRAGEPIVQQFSEGDRVVFVGPHSAMTINRDLHIPIGSRGSVVTKTPVTGSPLSGRPGVTWVSFGIKHWYDTVAVESFLLSRIEPDSVTAADQEQE